MSEIDATAIDSDTINAAKIFLQRIAGQFAADHAILFGSPARHSHLPDSDADIAVISNGAIGELAEAAITMTGITPRCNA